MPSHKSLTPHTWDGIVAAATRNPPIGELAMMHCIRAQIVASVAVLAVSAPAGSPGARAQPAALPDTPSCATAERLTPAQTAGPYYKANPPRRHVLESGRPGERIMVTGFVLAKGCRPVPGARVDVWQADGAGNYDNSGFKLRGWELTDAQGRYWFDTVVPGEYPGRTPHIHVKVTAPGRRTLTTQLLSAERDGQCARLHLQLRARHADGRGRRASRRALRLRRGRALRKGSSSHAPASFRFRRPRCRRHRPGHLAAGERTARVRCARCAGASISA